MEDLSKLRIVRADLEHEAHQRAIIELVGYYHEDPMGANCALPDRVKANLIEGLRRMSTALLLLAYLEEEAVGLATCLLSFSTFAARPVLNVHDLAVKPAYRSRGIGTALLHEAERVARDLNCCKLTLEVREDNIARRLYQRLGFRDAQPRMLFWHKPL